jgi:peroxiredoxin
MARTPSNMLALGTKAPDFALPNTIDNKTYSFDNISGTNGTVVMFICNHCPYVIHVMDGITALAKDYQNRGIGFIAISSNDVVNYPDDDPTLMKETAKKYGFSFPYLYDETQDVAKAYDAACTPDFYLFDSKKTLVYRGQMDSSRPKNELPVTGKDLRMALDAMLSEKTIDTLQKPSLGCNIKWKV